MKGQAASWLFAVFPTFILMDNCYLSLVICGMPTKSFAWSRVFLSVKRAAHTDLMRPAVLTWGAADFELGVSHWYISLFYADGKVYIHTTLLI